MRIANWKSIKTLCAALAIILITVGGLYSQDHCFEQCMENLKTSTIPFPNKNKVLLQGLVGCSAPDFEVETIDGATLKLGDLKGKVVVINFWFEACPPCIAEIPALNQLAEEYVADDVVFIAFGRDKAESIQTFLTTTNFMYEHVSADQVLIENYCVIGGWPTNMVLDKKGILRQIFSGGPTDERATTEAYEKMRPTIDKYLKV